MNSKELEAYFIRALVEGTFEGELPMSSQLAESMGVSRTMVREVLKKLEAYGFVEAKRGKPVKVRDFWKQGNLLTLAKIVECSSKLPKKVLTDLMEIRASFVPFFVEKVVREKPHSLVALLDGWDELEEPDEFVAFDWKLHKGVSLLSGNAVALLLINSFEGIYKWAASFYFTCERARESSKRFYEALIDACMEKDASKAAAITRKAMLESIAIMEEEYEKMERMGT